MAVTVVVETGESLEDSNSYVTVAEATTYQEANPYGSAWAAYSETKKAQGVITASRILDQQFQWNGYKSNAAQAMQWPRMLCPDPDSINQAVPGSTVLNDGMLAEDAIPKAIKEAVCALALVVHLTNRESDPQGEGISSFTLDGVMSVSFDKETRQPILPEWMTASLSKYGGLMRARGGVVRLKRV